MLPPYRHDGLSIAICSAIVSGPPIPPAFFGSPQDFVDFELEYEASDDYLNFRRVFDVTLVMRITLRGWRSSDNRSPLLIYLRKANRCSLASPASTENYIIINRPVSAR
jgi:hypothetical protein